MSQQINLFNPAFEKQKKLLSAAGMAIGAGVTVVGLAGLGMVLNAQVAGLQREADAGAARLDATQKRLGEVGTQFAPRASDPALAGQLGEAESQREALRRVADVIERGELGNTQGYAEYFRALARQRIDGLWLTGVRIAGAGLDLGVQGRALDPALVPGFLARLRHESVMQGKAVGNLQIGQAADMKRVDADGKESVEAAPYVEFSLTSNPVDPKAEAKP